jgi:hypothetical protein
MSNSEDQPERRVRFAATVAATAGAFRFAAPAILITFAAHLVIHATPEILSASHVTIARLPFGPRGWSTELPLAVASAIVSGLLIRWLLNPAPQARRADRRLAGYVGLLVLAYVLASLVGFAIGPNLRGKAVVDQVTLSVVAGVANLSMNIAYAVLALWPISVLNGDRLTPSQAVVRMSQALVVYIGLYVLLRLPPATYIAVRVAIARGAPMQLTERLINQAIYSATATLSYVVLAQIYSRRIRGCDLGQEPTGGVAAVFE